MEGCCRGVELFVATPDDLLCPLGRGVMCEPVLIKTCGHSFCGPCLKQYIEEKDTKDCAVCGKGYTEDSLVMMRNAKLRVLELTAYCDHKAEGCEWEGKFAFHDDHIQQCPFTEQVRCFFSQYGCDFEGTNEELHHHLLDQAQLHLEQTCNRLESYGDNKEAAVVPTTNLIVKQHGGVSDEQVELFQELVKKDVTPTDIAEAFRERYPGTAWTVLKCLRAECEQHIESLGFMEIIYGYHLWTLVANLSAQTEE
eukprot:TRINITY_DN6891_c0_g1_i1.p1 TRINITY_DN6891_c0_g1~~TRINITY_DN6891_c0_g1_i1.p1  ORF type:complete len:253 (+),score=43.32 TRINITY_DN6891_c0_g1_i1:90-848(+)